MKGSSHMKSKLISTAAVAAISALAAGISVAADERSRIVRQGVFADYDRAGEHQHPDVHDHQPEQLARGRSRFH